MPEYRGNYRYYRMGNRDALLPVDILTADDQVLLHRLQAPVGGMTFSADDTDRIVELQAKAIYL